jgi:hypothetical protein
MKNMPFLTSHPRCDVRWRRSSRHGLSLQPIWRLLTIGGVILASALPLAADESEPPSQLRQLTIQRDGTRSTIHGRVLVEAADGGILFESQDTRYWLLQVNEIVAQTPIDKPFRILERKEFTEQLLQEFPGFESSTTANYVIVHNTTRAYADWCGGLYERLHRAFLNYWKTRGLKLASPKYPLVAVVFKNRDAYEAYAVQDIGPSAKLMLGYFNIQTNRVVMFDLTGVENATFGRVTSADQVNRILLQPAAERTVATIVHEATHQISYNCGLQTRLAGNPKWVSEGMAIFFETPDLRNRRGWSGIGKIHRLHMANFLNRPPGNGVIRRIVSDDQQFGNAATAASAYSQAWALTYYLQKTRKKQYSQYIRGLSELEPLAEETVEQRISRFQSAFGDIPKLEGSFLAFMFR